METLKFPVRLRSLDVSGQSLGTERLSSAPSGTEAAKASFAETLDAEMVSQASVAKAPSKPANSIEGPVERPSSEVGMPEQTELPELPEQTGFTPPTEASLEQASLATPQGVAEAAPMEGDSSASPAILTAPEAAGLTTVDPALPDPVGPPVTSNLRPPAMSTTEDPPSVESGRTSGALGQDPVPLGEVETAAPMLPEEAPVDEGTFEGQAELQTDDPQSEDESPSEDLQVPLQGEGAGEALASSPLGARGTSSHETSSNSSRSTPMEGEAAPKPVVPPPSETKPASEVGAKDPQMPVDGPPMSDGSVGDLNGSETPNNVPSEDLEPLPATGDPLTPGVPSEEIASVESPVGRPAPLGAPGELAAAEETPNSESGPGDSLDAGMPSAESSMVDPSLAPQGEGTVPATSSTATEGAPATPPPAAVQPAPEPSSADVAVAEDAQSSLEESAALDSSTSALDEIQAVADAAADDRASLPGAREAVLPEGRVEVASGRNGTSERGATAPVGERSDVADMAPGKPSAEALARAERVLQQVRLQIRPNMNQATIQLNPAALGRVAIELAVTDGELTAVIRAERPEALSVLERHLPELRAMFQQSGIEVGDLDLGLGFQQEREAQLGDSQRGKQGTPHRSASAEESEQPVESALAARLSDLGVDTYA